MLLRRLGRRTEQDVRGSGENGSHLQPYRRYDLVADNEPPRVIDVDRAHQAAVGQPVGHPGNHLEPSWIGVFADQNRRACLNVDIDDAHRALVA